MKALETTEDKINHAKNEYKRLLEKMQNYQMHQELAEQFHIEYLYMELQHTRLIQSFTQEEKDKYFNAFRKETN